MTTVVEQIGPDARRRILECVYELFSTRAVRDVGIDEIVQRSGVAKATLYRHFPSKDALVVAFLQLREERWTYAFVEAGARGRGGEGEGALLAIGVIIGAAFGKIVASLVGDVLMAPIGQMLGGVYFTSLQF